MLYTRQSAGAQNTIPVSRSDASGGGEGGHKR